MDLSIIKMDDQWSPLPKSGGETPPLQKNNVIWEFFLLPRQSTLLARGVLVVPTRLR